MPRDTPPARSLDPARLAVMRDSIGEERVEALLILFRNELHRRLAAIARADAAGAHERLSEEANALASGARALGFEVLAERAAAAERAVSERNALNISAATAALAEAVHEALIALRRR